MSGAVDYYLPAGRWTSFITGEVADGGRWQREQHDYMSLPLMVRPNSAIVVGSEENWPDYEYANGFKLRLYQIADGARTTTAIPTPTGTVAICFSVERSDRTISAKWDGAPKQWQLMLQRAESVVAVEGGAWERCQDGTLVTPSAEATELTILLGSAE